MDHNLTQFDKYMAAAAFGEAGEEKAARDVLGGGTQGPLAAAKPAKRPYFKALVFGAVSLAAYVVLFKNQDWVTANYTKGGVYAAFPVLTALVFSFVHGTFGSSLLSTLGLEAKKK